MQARRLFYLSAKFYNATLSWAGLFSASLVRPFYPNIVVIHFQRTKAILADKQDILGIFPAAFPVFKPLT